MKKIMILMLSLAVLFSFAACDNSSNTPDNPVVDESTSITDAVIGDAMSKVKAAMANAEEDDTRSGVAALLYKNTNLLAASTDREVTFDKNDVTKITVKRTPVAAGEATSGIKVQLDVTAIDVSTKDYKGATKATAMTVALNTFTYTYSGDVTNADGKNVPFTATVNGFFGDGSTATIYEEDGTLNYIVDDASELNVILPKDSTGITLTIDNESVTDRLGFAFDALNLATGANVTTYKAYEGAQNKGFHDAVDGTYVKQLLSVNANGIISKLNTWAGKSPAEGDNKTATSWSAKYDASTKTATFKLAASVNPIVVSGLDTVSADTDVQVALAANEEMTVTLTGDFAGSTLTAKTYTISGKFVVREAASSSAWNADYSDVIDVTLSGEIDVDDDAENNKLTVTVDSTDATKVTATAIAGTPAFTVAADSKVTSTIAYGPLLVSAADPDEAKVAIAVLLDKAVERVYTAADPYKTV